MSFARSHNILHQVQLLQGAEPMLPSLHMDLSIKTWMLCAILVCPALLTRLTGSPL